MTEVAGYCPEVLGGIAYQRGALYAVGWGHGSWSHAQGECSRWGTSRQMSPRTDQGKKGVLVIKEIQKQKAFLICVDVQRQHI